jgi:hypothetical protein
LPDGNLEISSDEPLAVAAFRFDLETEGRPFAMSAIPVFAGREQ